MAIRILTTIAILLCVNSAVSFFDFGNIANSGFVLKGFTIPCGRNERFEYQCGDVDNSCIYSFFQCDGVIDCPNGADENGKDCETEWEELCANEIGNFPKKKPFKTASCQNGMCITECDMCDGYYIDCADGSDEAPDLCFGENRPQIVGNCTSYRNSYPIPTDP